MRSRRADESRVRALIEGLNAMSDELRAGRSLRQALMASSRTAGSPLSPIAEALDEGRHLAGVLRTGAAHGDGDLASVCCILAVHTEAGGDPLPAVRALAKRLGRRITDRAEARALTTQARLGARAIVLLTPAFLLLVALSDPGGAVSWFSDARTRSLLVAGVALQGLGALWVRSIIAGAVPSPHTPLMSEIPVLRAARAIFAGRSRSNSAPDIAEGAELIALAADAGLSTTAAVGAVAPHAPGTFGEAIRRAVDQGTPLHHAIGDELLAFDGVGADRFVRALEASIELGAPIATPMRVLASELREGESRRIAEDVRRASVRVLVPLAVVLLPAFVLSCLMPLLLGGLRGITG